MKRKFRTYKHKRTPEEFSPVKLWSNWRRRRGLDHALREPAKKSWSQAIAVTEKDNDEFVLYDYAFSFFPREFTDAARDQGLMVGLCSQKEMTQTVRWARKHSVLPRQHEFLVRTHGLFDGRALTIDVVQSVKPEQLFGVSLGWQSVVDIIGHEFCHFADWCCAGVSEYSRSFRKCFLADRHALENTSAESPTEFFATAGWICLRYPQQAAQYIPKTFKWFEYFWFANRLSDQDVVDIAEGKKDLNKEQDTFWEDVLSADSN